MKKYVTLKKVENTYILNLRKGKGYFKQNRIPKNHKKEDRKFGFHINPVENNGSTVKNE